MREYIFTPYDKAFSRIFLREKYKLKRILPFAIKIEHFGSTAVPGLGGKGVIDIYIIVSKNKFGLAKDKLVEGGYPYYATSEFDDGLRMVFRKKYLYAGKLRKVHLHVVTPGSKDFERVITFRDNLRNNRELCREYELVKRLAIKITRNSGEDSKENARIYVDAKTSFIKKYNDLQKKTAASTNSATKTK